MKQSSPIGRVPTASALGTLLAHHKVHNPLTKKPFTEAMLYGIAGGVGIGAVSFHYAKEDFSSTFLAGRHLWFDDLLYLQNACKRLGVKTKVLESGGAKAAEKLLREVLEQGPCIAWVDLAGLPHRGMDGRMSGGGYHVIVVHRIDGDAALIGDLAAEPIPIPLADLAAARARIAKQKNRLLTIAPAKKPIDLSVAVNEGLQACRQALTMKGGKGPYAMATLDSLKRWADRLHGSKDKDSWENIFPPGKNLWRGLTSIHQFIEHYGNGGSLGRAIMAEFLEEVAKSLKDKNLKKLAGRYTELAKQWYDLAKAALPNGVPLFKEVRELQARYASLLLSNGPTDEKKAVWARLDELVQSASDCFPLNAAQCADLRADLQQRVRQIIVEESSALG